MNPICFSHQHMFLIYIKSEYSSNQNHHMVIQHNFHSYLTTYHLLETPENTWSESTDSVYFGRPWNFFKTFFKCLKSTKLHLPAKRRYTIVWKSKVIWVSLRYFIPFCSMRCLLKVSMSDIKSLKCLNIIRISLVIKDITQHHFVTKSSGTLYM